MVKVGHAFTQLLLNASTFVNVKMPCPNDPITFDATYQRFTLCNQHYAYIFRVDNDGDLVQEHFGPSISLGAPEA